MKKNIFVRKVSHNFSYRLGKNAQRFIIKNLINREIRLAQRFGHRISGVFILDGNKILPIK